MENAIRSALRMLDKAKSSPLDLTRAYIDCAAAVLEESLPKTSTPRKVEQAQDDEPKPDPTPEKNEYELQINRTTRVLELIKDASGKELAPDKAIELDGTLMRYDQAKGNPVSKVCRVVEKES